MWKKIENKNWDEQWQEVRQKLFPGFKHKMISGFEKIVKMKKVKKEYEQLHKSK